MKRRDAASSAHFAPAKFARASTKFDRSLRSSFAAIPAIHENALRIPVVLSSAAVNLLIERDVRTLANTRRTSCCTPSGALV
jgi:hypothetical protein